MRNDMFKVIVERPRRGVGYYRTLPNEYRAAKRFKLNEDFEVNDEFCGRTVPMRARCLGYDGKQLNENLNPLRRYLETQVGRRWDDVYSEICKQLDTGSTIKQHVRQHLTDFVSLKTFIDEDGDLRSNTRWGVRDGGYNDLWVDPNGILCSYQTQQKNYRNSNSNSYYKNRRDRMIAEAWKTHRTIDGIEYERINNLWFRLEKTEHWVTRSYWLNGGVVKRLEKHVDIRKWSVNKKELRDLKLYE